MDLKDIKISANGEPQVLLPAPAETLLPPVEECCELVIAVLPDDFQASRIARAVEDADANLLNLNVAATRTEFAEMIVYLRADRRGPHAIVRSLERYGFRVIAVGETPAGFPAEEDDASDSARQRVNALLRYLEV